MIRINLLGHEPTKARKRRAAAPDLGAGGSPTIPFVLALAATLLVLGAAWWYQSSRLADLRTARDAAVAERDELAETAQRVRQVQDRTALVNQKLEVIVDLKRNQSGPVMLLDQVSRLLPANVWLTQMTVEEGNVTILGGALSGPAVADFMEALRLSPDFADQTLAFTEDTGNAERFQLTVRFIPLTPPPEPVQDEPGTAPGQGQTQPGG